MGISGRRVGAIVLAVGVTVFFASTIEAQNKFLENLEAGQVVSSKTGASVLAQSIIQKDSATVLKALTEDLSQLPRIFPQVALARAFKSGDKNLLYLKLRGLGDGATALVEYKQGPLETFANAREFLKSGELGSFREPLRKEIAEVGDGGLGGLVREANAAKSVQRVLGAETVIEIEGPLFPIRQYPGVRVSLQIAIAPYTVTPAPAVKATTTTEPTKNLTLLSLRAAFGNQVSRGGDLGDYRGFGDREVDTARLVGEDVLRIVKARLEKI